MICCELEFHVRDLLLLYDTCSSTCLHQPTGEPAHDWDMCQYEDCLSRDWNSYYKVRRSQDCLTIIVGISILVRQHHYSEIAPEQYDPYLTKSSWLKIEYHWNVFQRVSLITGSAIGLTPERRQATVSTMLIKVPMTSYHQTFISQNKVKSPLS